MAYQKLQTPLGYDRGSALSNFKFLIFIGLALELFTF
jgi:hypothetical protein